MIEKTLTISGHEVKFKSTAGTLRHYRNTFGRDMLKDVVHLKSKLEKIKNQNEQFDVIDLGMFEDLAWSMAKTADNNVKPIETWLDDFETFEITKIFPVIMDLLIGNMKSGETEQKNIEALTSEEK